MATRRRDWMTRAAAEERRCVAACARWWRPNLWPLRTTWFCESGRILAKLGAIKHKDGQTPKKTLPSLAPNHKNHKIKKTIRRPAYRSLASLCLRIGRRVVRIQWGLALWVGAHSRSLPYYSRLNGKMEDIIVAVWYETSRKMISLVGSDNKCYHRDPRVITSTRRRHGPFCQWLGSCFGWPLYGRQLLPLTRERDQFVYE